MTYRILEYLTNLQKPQIPDADSNDREEVMKFAGLALFYAQILEDNVRWLASILHLPEPIVFGADELRSSRERFEQSTLGQLVRAIRKRVPVPPRLEDELRAALDARNQFIHGYFPSHQANYLSESGRSEMIKELRSISQTLKTMTETTMKILHALAVGLQL